eukprot:771213_1
MEDISTCTHPRCTRHCNHGDCNHPTLATHESDYNNNYNDTMHNIEHMDISHLPNMYTSIPDILQLHKESLCKYFEIPEFNIKEFSEYYRCLQIDNPCHISKENASNDDEQYVIQEWDSKHSKLSNSFRITTTDSDGPFCMCKMYKNHKLCSHSLIIEIGSNYQKYNTIPLFQSVVVSDGVFRINRRNLTGIRRNAYYINQGVFPQIVYENNDGCITCSLCKQNPKCPDRLRLMEYLCVTHREYHEQRAEIIISSNDRDFVVNKPHSFQSVPVPKNHRIDNTENDSEYDQYQYDSSQFVGAPFIPEYKHCRHCSTSFHSFDPDTNDCIQNYSIFSHQSVLYGLETTYDCTVEYYKCNTCGNMNEFDGRNNHIFNYDGFSMYTHSLLNHRSNNLHTARASSWESWNKTQSRVYMENGSKYRFSGSKLMNAWNGFITFIQQWGYEFTCPWCDRGGDNKGECNSIGYDAIVIFLKQYRAQKCVNPTTIYDQSEIVRNKSNRCNRYISDCSARQLALRWYQSIFSKYDRESKLDPLKRKKK